MITSASLVQNRLPDGIGEEDGVSQTGESYNTSIGGYYVDEDGYRPSKSFVMVFSLLLGILCVNHGCFVGTLLMTVAFFPGAVIISMFKSQIRRREISVRTVSDLFTFGATISVLTSFLFEGLIFGLLLGTRDGQCDHFVYNRFGCKVGFPLYIFATILKYITCIGLVEEGCKLMGLFTIKSHIEDLRHKESFTSHYVNSNFGFVIAGMSSSLGFALIENVVYLSNSLESIIRMLFIGIARAFLSVPFHVSASGYTSILISRQVYARDGDSLGRQNTGSSSSPLEKCFKRLASLLPAGVLHGVYDSSLVILTTLEQDQESDPSRHLASSIRESPSGQGAVLTKISRLVALLRSPPFPKSFRNKLIGSIQDQTSVQSPFSQCFHNEPLLLDLLGFGFFILSVLAFSTCVFLFFHNWMHLKKETFDRRLMVVTRAMRDQREGEIELVDEYIQI